MEMTEELRLSILTLWHEALDKDVDSFCTLLKDKASRLGVPYPTLLQLVFNKEYLFYATLPKIEKLNREINDLQKQIDALKLQKQLLGIMICEMHGHTISEYDSSSRTQYCVVCGADVRIDNTNQFLRERDELKRGFYPER